MKRKILPVLTLLAAMTLVACGGKPADKSGAAPAKSTAATSKSSAATSRHTHTFNEQVWEHDEENHWHPATCEHTTVHGSEAPHTFVVDTTKSTLPTCKTAGSIVEKCSVCGYEKAPVAVAASYQYHTLGERTWTKKAATKDNLSAKTEVKELECSTCHSKDVAINALDYVAFNDADTSKDFNKIADGSRLKFGANNSWAEYKFDSTNEFDAMLYLYGCVDYWKDGNNNNHNRGFFNSGNAVNIAVELNSGNVTVTNTHSYAEMGIPDPVEPNPLPNSTSGFGFAEVALVHIQKGENTLKYTRKGSYNMDITEIHFIEHKHEYVVGDTGPLRTLSCECGLAGYQLNAEDATEGQKAPNASNKDTRLGKGSVYDDVWNITGIAAGTYDFFIEAQASAGNTNAYWNAGTAQTVGKDSASNNGNGSTDYRYKVKIGDGEYVNLGSADDTAIDQYSEFGLSDSARAWTNKPVCRITVPADSTALTLHNMNNGYAIWVFGVRLVKVA